MDISDVLKDRISELTDVDAAWTSMYNERFASYFIRVHQLDEAYRSKSVIISDVDLESILTELPLTLFSVSETLNQLRLEYEVMKLENKSRKVEYRNYAIRSINEFIDSKGGQATKADVQRAVEDEVTVKCRDDEVVTKIYETVISRVENEITFTKELIMAAKKLWDSRRNAENSNPVSEVDPELPDYSKVNVGTYRSTVGQGSTPIGSKPSGTHPGNDYIK